MLADHLGLIELGFVAAIALGWGLLELRSLRRRSPRKPPPERPILPPDTPKNS